MSRKRSKQPHAIRDVFAALGLAIFSACLVAPLSQGGQLLCLFGFLLAGGAAAGWKGAHGKWEQSFIPGMFFLMEWVIVSGRAHGIRMGVTLGEKTALFTLIGLVTAVLGGAFVFWLLREYITKEGRKWILFLAAFGALCSFQLGYDSSLSVNALAYRMIAKEAVAVVEGVQTATYAAGRYATGKVYSLLLKENALMEKGGRVKAAAALAKSLQQGDAVRLLLHPGALGVPWLECVPLTEEKGERQ